jgi:hypothetical protein
MAAKNKRKRRVAIEVATPTDEQLGRGEYRRANHGHYRKVPVIDTMLERRQLTFQEYQRLAFYRDTILQSEEDEANESSLSPDKIMGGSSPSHPVGGYTPKNLIATPAMIAAARLDRDLGSLREIAREVVAGDKSLVRWCIDKFGGRERYDGNGRFIAIVPISEKKVIAKAIQDIKFAAGRIVP